MDTTDKKWDFFIAYAGPDTPIAEQLHDLLAGSATVFLDVRSIELGDNWDLTLAAAQRQSRVTVVLVSQVTDSAYYERVEVAQAINLSRDPAQGHRVIPLYLDEASTKTLSAQYGLNLKHGLFLSEATTLEAAAYRLLATLKRLQYGSLLFDSRHGAASQFRGYPNSYWAGKGADSRRSSPIGEGTLAVEPGGVLVVRRTSTEGRFEVQLLEREAVGPKNTRKTFPPTSLEAPRGVWVHCEACSTEATHKIRFVLKNEAMGSWLASETRTVASATWVELDVFLWVDPKSDFWFRIDAEEVSIVPSELRLKNIVIRECP